MKYQKRNRAFTLVELIIILVLIGILSAIAIPRFGDLIANADRSSLEGTLGNVRSALSVQMLNNVAQHINIATNSWPTLEEVKNASNNASLAASPLETRLPNNPYNDNNQVVGRSEGQANARTVSGGAEGWAYCETLGVFYANSSTTGENSL